MSITRVRWKLGMDLHCFSLGTLPTFTFCSVYKPEKVVGLVAGLVIQRTVL